MWIGLASTQGNPRLLAQVAGSFMLSMQYVAFDAHKGRQVKLPEGGGDGLQVGHKLDLSSR
jgi:hypothetical protein